VSGFQTYHMLILLSFYVGSRRNSYRNRRDIERRPAEVLLFRDFSIGCAHRQSSAYSAYTIQGHDEQATTPSLLEAA
jgi:hypothetical protein